MFIRSFWYFRSPFKIAPVFLSFIHLFSYFSFNSPVLAAAPDRPPDFYPPTFILHTTLYLPRYFLIISFPYYTITLPIFYLCISRKPPTLTMLLPGHYDFYNYLLHFFYYIYLSAVYALVVSITTSYFSFYSIVYSYFFITHLSSLQLQTNCSPITCHIYRLTLQYSLRHFYFYLLSFPASKYITYVDSIIF